MLWLFVRGASTELNSDNDTLDQYDCYNANFLIIECSPLEILKGSEKTLKFVFLLLQPISIFSLLKGFIITLKKTF